MQHIVQILEGNVVGHVACHHVGCTETDLRLVVDPYFTELYTQDEIDQLDDDNVRKWTCDEHEQDLYDAL